MPQSVGGECYFADSVRDQSIHHLCAVERRSAGRLATSADALVRFVLSTIMSSRVPTKRPHRCAERASQILSLIHISEPTRPY